MQSTSRRLHRRTAASALTLAALLLARPANAEDPVLLSVYAPQGLYYEAQVVGSIVYMAGADFFHVVNVSDPTQPSALAIRDMSFAVGLEVVGSRVYVAQYLEPILQVLSIANPAAPTPIGEWSSPPGTGAAFKLDVVGDLVYLITESGLRILDVSALPTITEVGTFEPPEPLHAVAVSAGHAYVAADQAGVFIVDVSDPTMPDHVDTLSGSTVGSVEIEGTHLYVGGSEFRVFDVSNPGSPVLVGQTPIPAPIELGAMRVDGAEGIAYGGRSVIDVSDVTQPSLLATISVPSPVGDVVYSDGSNGILYAPHLIAGLHIFRIFPSTRTPVVPILGGLVALPLALVGWRAIRRRSSR